MLRLFCTQIKANKRKETATKRHVQDLITIQQLRICLGRQGNRKLRFGLVR
jgi:hypothetical protein